MSYAIIVEATDTSTGFSFKKYLNSCNVNTDKDALEVVQQVVNKPCNSHLGPFKLRILGVRVNGKEHEMCEQKRAAFYAGN